MAKKLVTKKLLDEGKKAFVLDEAKKLFKVLSSKHGFELSSWAFRKVLETNSKQRNLLKRKEALESELKEIEGKL